MVTSQFSDEFGTDFRNVWEPPPVPDTAPVPGMGWREEVSPPVAVLCDLSGLPVVELPLVSWQVADALSRPTEATFVVNTTLYPRLEALLAPWQQTIVFIADGQPVWGGTVVKRRVPLGKTSAEVTCREWTAWLDRVWTTPATEYVSPVTPDDAGFVVKQRIEAAASLAVDADVVPPLSPMRWTGPAGATTELEFYSQEDVTNPQTILNEITTLIQDAGIDWQVWWVEDGGRYYPELRTTVFDANATPRELVVGADCATATLEVDSDSQATRVKVVGEADEAVAGGLVAGNPPLWRAYSYDKVLAPANLATQIHALVMQPLFGVTDLRVPGTRHDWRPGDLVLIVVPSDFDPRYPLGLDLTLRVTDVAWSGSDTERSTSLTVSSLWDQIPNQPLALASVDPTPSHARLPFTEGLKRLAARVQALELRR